MKEQCENKGSSFCADFECKECPIESLSRKLPVIPDPATMSELTAEERQRIFLHLGTLLFDGFPTDPTVKKILSYIETLLTQNIAKCQLHEKEALKTLVERIEQIVTIPKGHSVKWVPPDEFCYEHNPDCKLCAWQNLKQEVLGE